MPGIECNPIPADLDDWTKAPFPVNVPRPNGGYLLLGTLAGRVIGAQWHGTGLDEAGPSSVIACDWSGNGAFGVGGVRGKYPTMELPPPPAHIGERVAEIDATIADLTERLAAHPLAPADWRAADEREIARLKTERDKLAPSDAEA